MKVKDCMCGEVCCVKPDTKVYEVAKLMEKNHIGCVPLRDAILEKTPKLVLHGHLHSTNHNAELMEPSNTKVYNVSYVDEGYEPVYSPLVLEI